CSISILLAFAQPPLYNRRQLCRFSSWLRCFLPRYDPMPSELVSPEATPGLWEQEIWDELLAYVEDGRVIPIVGPDLLRVEVDGQTVVLDQYLARKLAARQGLPADALPAAPTLNQVVCQLLRRQRRREALYAAIRDIVLKTPLAVPKPLRQLA